MPEVKSIYCCACSGQVFARLTNGAEIYPNRTDLNEIPFWKCDKCGNHVGCHHKTANPTAQLGPIPTPELRNARSKIHKLIDPLWKYGYISRSDLYKRISDQIGYQYHTGRLVDIEQARAVYAIGQSIGKELTSATN